MMATLRPVVWGIAFGAGAGVAALPAGAELHPHSFSVRVISLDPGVTAIAVGDAFDIGFTVDDSAIDNASSVGAGHFEGLLTSFSMTAHPGNLGSWEPSGVFDLGVESNFVTNAFGDNFTFELRGTGMPGGGSPGLLFLDIDLSWTWPADISDSGLGDTFGEQFEGGFDPALASLRPGGVRFISGTLEIPQATFVELPEPGLGFLLLAALAAARRVRARHPTR